MSINTINPATGQLVREFDPLPAAKAGAANRNTCQKGKFHGIIANTTPNG